MTKTTKIIFDKKALNWDDNDMYRDTFLLGMKQHMKCLIQSRGWATLADVADILGVNPYTYVDFMAYGKVLFSKESDLDNIMRYIEVKR